MEKNVKSCLTYIACWVNAKGSYAVFFLIGFIFVHKLLNSNRFNVKVRRFESDILSGMGGGVSDILLYANHLDLGSS